MDNAKRQMLAQFVANTQQLINVAHDLKIETKWLELTWENSINQLAKLVEEPKTNE